MEWLIGLRRSGSVAGQLRIQNTGSIHIATAILAGAQTFLTNDKRLAKPLSIQVLILDDFLESK